MDDCNAKLSGVRDTEYISAPKTAAAAQGFSFIFAPSAEILVVDDSRVNLNVAVGMLKLCGINADTADDAHACYEKIRNKKYDIVFMDHILPGTDGVEATKYLRKNGFGDLVIIALTANTAIGARDLFKNCGMNDFMPKPIDKVLLNDMLIKWLPPEKLLSPENTGGSYENPLPEKLKTPTVSQGLHIIDSDKAIVSLGDKDLYFSILNTYYDETPEKIKGMTQALADGDMNLFTILVHSVKSTSALIGALVPFRLAKEMEEAARNGETKYVTENYPGLLGLLNSTLAEVSAMISPKPHVTSKPSKLDKALLANLYLACETMESLQIDEAMSELSANCKTPEDKAFVQKISELIDAFELTQAMELLLC